MNKKVKIIIGIVVAIVLLLGSSAGGAYIGYTLANKEKTEKEMIEKGEVPVKVDKKNLQVVTLSSEIIANIPDNHIIKTQLGIEVNKKHKFYKKFTKTLSEDEILIRDELIKVLREQTFEMMSRADAQTKLAEEIKTALNKKLDTDIITEIYFKDLFVQ